MRRLWVAMFFGTIIPALVAVLFYYVDKDQRAKLVPVSVRIHHAEVQSIEKTAKQLKQLSVHYSYTAFGHFYEWNGYYPLSSLQYEDAYSLVIAAQKKENFEAWVQKESPNKLVLFPPQSSFGIPLYFGLVCIAFLVILISMFVGSGLTWHSRGTR